MSSYVIEDEESHLPLHSCKLDREYGVSPEKRNSCKKKSWFSWLKSGSGSLKGSDSLQFTMISKSLPEYKDASEQTSRDWLSNLSTKRDNTCGQLPWSTLPIILSITTVVGFAATYIFAKKNCHIEQWALPYVSYTGTEYPESMLFGLIMNMEGFLGLTVVFLAWRYYRHMGQRGRLNTFALCLGGLSCAGVIIVGNFQVTKGKIPHYIGAGLAFIIGTCYGVLTAILSRKAFRFAEPPLRCASLVSGIRIVLAMIMVVTLSCLSGFGMYKKLSKKLNYQELDNDLLIHPNGSCRDNFPNMSPVLRSIDLLASLTEWILTASLLFCLSLYAYEFRTFQKVKVVLLRRDGPLRGSQQQSSNSSKVSCKPQLFLPVNKSCHGKANAVSPQHPINSSPHCVQQNSRSNSVQNLQLTQHPNSSLCRLTLVSNLPTADSGIEDDATHPDADSTISVEQQRINSPSETRLSRTLSLPNMVQYDLV